MLNYGMAFVAIVFGVVGVVWKAPEFSDYGIIAAILAVAFAVRSLGTSK